MTQHKHEHGFSETIEHSLPADGTRFVLDEHQAGERVQFGRRVTVFAAHHDQTGRSSTGYTRAQVIEVLLGVGMKTFNNYVDHIAHTPLNDQFTAEA
jgi:hypothetical protein